MTQEEKQLLLKEICTRLPYGVICTDLRHGDSKITEVDIEDGLVYCFDFDEYVKVEDCRLYLRPMSSMTKEEENEYRAINCYEGLFPRNEDALDYILSHHFDYRGLIDKSLALEAPEDMYKIE